MTLRCIQTAPGEAYQVRPQALGDSFSVPVGVQARV